MYQTLLEGHSYLRWLVLVSLLCSIYIAYKGYSQKLSFTKTANLFRHWTATIAHIQLLFGILVYLQSPIVKYFWRNYKEEFQNLDASFFGIIHIALMLIAIIIVTIGSALSKRRKTDEEKFKTMLFWFLIALVIIFIAIPWPFSPLANRPYFR
ncbi:hypothetical protein [Flavobacterium phragmitis]|uniref:Cytochrome B n=1 Tax=Flavobacterium phragmitis TaxID=739143 RepID=A0A1I1MCI0_9FLAO|nr:hypothetical protein [Flavobacterium phragmitis]SFC79390.1 hypothetical protein SAMN05216297_102304 [Flavobacterium phragmitis]